MQIQSLTSLYDENEKGNKVNTRFGQVTPDDQHLTTDKVVNKVVDKSLPPLPEIKENIGEDKNLDKEKDKVNPEVKEEKILPNVPNTTAPDVSGAKVEIKQSKPKYDIFELLDKAVSLGASDLHLNVNYPPFLRVDGKLIAVGVDNVDSAEMEVLVAPILGQKFQEQLEINREVDFSYAHSNVARFRVNAFYQKKSISAALRLIPNKIPTLAELKVPPIIEQFTQLPQGFILVVGPTGSGKSTTLASMINLINERDNKHIITIEDPIEYVFEPAKSIVAQREVGSDTHSWEIALRSVLREDPNIVLVGEMRDYETIAAALTVAETGHLVFATLHTNSASQAIDRIIHVFPSEQQAQVRIMLANVITAVISQRLIPTIGGGRRAAMEILVGNPAISNMIRDSKEHLIDNVIQTGLDAGMVPMEKSLVSLIREGKITIEEAQKHTTKVDELLRMLNQS